MENIVLGIMMISVLVVVVLCAILLCIVSVMLCRIIKLNYATLGNVDNHDYSMFREPNITNEDDDDDILDDNTREMIAAFYDSAVHDLKNIESKDTTDEPDETDDEVEDSSGAVENIKPVEPDKDTFDEISAHFRYNTETEDDYEDSDTDDYEPVSDLLYSLYTTSSNIDIDEGETLTNNDGVLLRCTVDDEESASDSVLDVVADVANDIAEAFADLIIDVGDTVEVFSDVTEVEPDVIAAKEAEAMEKIQAFNDSITNTGDDTSDSSDVVEDPESVEEQPVEPEPQQTIPYSPPKILGYNPPAPPTCAPLVRADGSVIVIKEPRF